MIGKENNAHRSREALMLRRSNANSENAPTVKESRSRTTTDRGFSTVVVISIPLISQTPTVFKVSYLMPVSAMAIELSTARSEWEANKAARVDQPDTRE
jgi:hypothetical protein